MGMDGVPDMWDLIWVDLGAGDRLRSFIEGIWHNINPKGGLLMVHSTVTNRTSRRWLDMMRAAAGNAVSGGGRKQKIERM